MRIKIIPVLLIGALCFSGCKKDKDDPTPVPGGGGNPVATGPPNGELLAYKYTFILGGGDEMSHGYAMAHFKNGADRVNVGAVTCNGAAVPWDDEEDGYEGGTSLLENTYNWSISGGNGWPAFTTNAGGATRPVISGGVTSPTQFSIANSYAFSVGGVAGADSTYFLVGSVEKKFAGNVTSANFTSAELQHLQGQPGVFGEVTTRKRVRQTHGGKTVDVVLAEVVSVMLTLQ